VFICLFVHVFYHVFNVLKLKLFYLLIHVHVLLYFFIVYTSYSNLIFEFMFRMYFVIDCFLVSPEHSLCICIVIVLCMWV